MGSTKTRELKGCTSLHTAQISFTPLNSLLPLTWITIFFIKMYLHKFLVWLLSPDWCLTDTRLRPVSCNTYCLRIAYLHPSPKSLFSITSRLKPLNDIDTTLTSYKHKHKTLFQDKILSINAGKSQVWWPSWAGFLVFIFSSGSTQSPLPCVYLTQTFGWLHPSSLWRPHSGLWKVPRGTVPGSFIAVMGHSSNSTFFFN